MKNIIKFYIIVFVICFSFIIIGYNNCYASNNVKFQSADNVNTYYTIEFNHYDFNLDTYKINNITFYIPKDELYKSLVYIKSVNNYDTISSNAIKVNKKYYKFDLYKENKNNILVFYEFINEDIGREVAININKLNIDSLINLINK
jgi:hypothetical protein